MFLSFFVPVVLDDNSKEQDSKFFLASLEENGGINIIVQILFSERPLVGIRVPAPRLRF